jgi:hypothetical protein
MIIQEIQSQMEKFISTAVGLFISTIFGANIIGQVNAFFPASNILEFLIELISKALIAVVSGVATYLAIHNVKKIFKHK